MPPIFDVFFILIPFFCSYFSKEIKINWSLIRIKSPEKKLKTKLKKHKILYNLSTIIYEKMNNKTLYHEKTLPFRVIFNVAIIF